MESKTPTKLYLYMGRRDKKGITVIAVFQGIAKTCRVDNVNALGLDGVTTSQIQNIAHQNRMYHELWIEPASSYTELSQQLMKRGYSKLPLASTPMLGINQGHTINTQNLPHQKVMTRKKP